MGLCRDIGIWYHKYNMSVSGNEGVKGNLILQVSKIWKSFQTGDQHTGVLKNITTDIKQGEFVMLFGPSGCGKSTLLNTLMGLEHPDSGGVDFMGMKIWDLTSDDRAVIRKKNIGIIYQQQNWVKSLDVLGNVALVGSLLGYSKEEAKRVAEEKLAVVGMTHRATYQPYELSSGEQQRISLARALMSNPPLLIADEPTGNLDIKAGLKVMNIFKKLADEGKTVLMVTHNTGSLDFADRILFMIDGRIRKDIQVNESNIEDIKDRVSQDLELFIEEAKVEGSQETQNAPEPVVYKDKPSKGKEKFKGFFHSVSYNVVFTISMFLLLFLYVPAYLLETIIFKKSGLAGKTRSFIMNLFNKLGNSKKRVESSISDWDLGEISLSHLMEKKSRTLITVLGMGIGIGFITFLLSLGYGIENLVIDEMAELEERRQITISPIIGSEVVLDSERYELVKSVDGIANVYPLINIATTLYYGDSQTDVVAYGVGSSYLDAIKVVYLDGRNFSESEKELVLGDEVLNMLGVEGEKIINDKLFLEFIPVGEENIASTPGEGDVSGEYDSKIDYSVSGITINSGSPIIYFPIEHAKELGITEYSELLVELDEKTDMVTVRKEIETFGMKTSSVMDTVSEVEAMFGYLRLILAVIGAVAFIIAILGMVNTLIVSLMERTREVGLLKSIGMRSNEIQRLFINEAMLISFSGGVAGVFLGMLGGLLVSLVFSIISMSKGGEYIFVSKIPILLILTILFVCVILGYITGLYPSKRAVRMSPLDALRYE